MSSVYVLNQVMSDRTICTSTFKYLNACINSVIMELKEHIQEFSKDDEKKARKELRDQMYYTDGSTKYYIESCSVFEGRK